MNFSNIFKSSFYENYVTTGIELGNVVIALSVSCIIGIYIFALYGLLSKNRFYQKEFAISIPMLTVVTAAVILAIQSNIVISLGMVGALSIVRFRTAIKNPMDLVFLFWGISIGIICGAKLFGLAVVVSVTLTILAVFLDKLPSILPPTLLMIHTKTVEDGQILEVIEEYCSSSVFKTRNMSKGHMDMILEIKTKKEQELLVALQQIEDVVSVSLMEHDGEITY